MKNGRRYNYIRKRIPPGTLPAILTVLVSFSLFVFCIVTSVRFAGDGPMILGSAGITSMVFSVFSLYFVFMAFRERENVNLIPARISGVISSLLLFIWLMLIFLGMRRDL